MSGQIDMKTILSQAQKMQSKVKEAHDALANMTVRGQSGDEEAGVSVVMSGQHDASDTFISTGLLKTLLGEKVSIDESQLQEMAATLGQIVTAAINDTVQKVREVSRQKLSELAVDIQPSLLEKEGE